MKILFKLCALVILFFIATDCNKQGTLFSKKGCTDYTAVNYDHNATEDCCCQYGKYVVYYSTARYYDSSSKKYYDVDSIRTRINGDSVTLKQVFDKNEPDCGAAGTWTMPQQSFQSDLSWHITVYFKKGYYLEDNATILFGGSAACMKVKVF
jgi:hypothetical protein